MQKPQTADEYWSGCYDKGGDFRLISAGALTKILSFTDPITPKTCLDIGCGTGQLTRELAHRGYNCAGMDVATSAISIARSLTTSKNLAYYHMDIERDSIAHLPYQPYGLITCKYVYAFMHKKADFLERVKNLLAQNGTFVVTTPLLQDVPKEKLAIAVDYDKTLSELKTVFSRVDSYPVQEATTFIGRGLITYPD